MNSKGGPCGARRPVGSSGICSLASIRRFWPPQSVTALCKVKNLYARTRTRQWVKGQGGLPAGYPNQIISHQGTGWSGSDPPPVPPTVAPLNETNLVSYMNKDIMTFERDRVESVEQEPRPNPYVHGQTFVGDGVNELPNAYEGPQGSRPTQYSYNQASVGDVLDNFIGASKEQPTTRPTPYLKNPARVG